MSQDARNTATDTDLEPRIDGGNPAGAGTGKSSRPRQPDLTKISANFVPRAVAALDLAAELTNDSRTDVLNRAVQAYAYLAKMIDDGNLIFVENPITGAKERLVFL
uniref:hypothetical protein n=1 Tax=Actinoplanes sp. CA-084688 TaxID=3239901 RepID=UPI003F491CA3